VRLLLAAGADPSTSSPGDEAWLHRAASSDDADVARDLTEGCMRVRDRVGDVQAGVRAT
jgi:hypothetical protein